MKFAEHLHNEVIPEWRTKYIDYKEGKKYLKAIEAVLAQPRDYTLEKKPQAEAPEPPSDSTPILSYNSDHRSYSAIHTQPMESGVLHPDRVSNASTANEQDVGLSAEEPMQMPMLRTLTRRFTSAPVRVSTPRSRAIHVAEGDAIESVFDRLLPEEKDFFRFLNKQLEKVDGFYKDKELEAVTKLKVIRQQLFVADEWKRRYDENMAKAAAEQGWYQTEWSRVRIGFDSLLGSDMIATEDVTLPQASSSASLTPMQHPPTSSTTTLGDGSDDLGFDSRDPKGLSGPRCQQKPGGVSGHAGGKPNVEDEESRQQHLNHKVAKSRIKAALYEFYRSLEMLKSYRNLNRTGFTKIMKKFDKTARWKASKVFAATKLRPAYFMSSEILQDLTTETEDLFIDSFENGHRRRGMDKLRIPDSKGQTHHFTVARMGLYLGLALPLMVQGVMSALSKETQEDIPYWEGLLLVYAGLFLTTLFVCLFGVNMYVWSKNRINYKFIFEFDPRDNLDYHEFFELPIFFMLLLSLAVYFDFGSKLTAHVATAYWPLILIIITGTILFCPLPIAKFSARTWFLTSMVRILGSGYYPVEFRDFFLADELNSLSYSIEQLEFAACAYSHEWSDVAKQCQTSHMWITPFLAALPPWFRFLQCLRRYKDTLEWYPHLLNAGKYSMSLLTIFIFFSFRHYGGKVLKALWILASLITSTYTFIWDVKNDWGLFQFGKYGGAAYGHPWLRPELVYSREWVYYMAIGLNLLARFSWIMRLLPLGIHPAVLSFSLALVEVLRRWQWNFFRLENEHLNNCGQFRAIKDIPLPFHILMDGESGESEAEDNEEEVPDEGATGPQIPTIATDGEDQDEVVSLDGRVPLLSKDTHRQPKVARAATYGSMGSGLSGAEDSSSGAPLSTGLRKRKTMAPGDRLLLPPGAGIARSHTFVDTALAEAGFGDEQREAIESSSKIRNKFFERRDFDTKIMDVEALVRSMSGPGKGGGGGKSAGKKVVMAPANPRGAGSSKRGEDEDDDDDDDDDDEDEEEERQRRK